MKPVVIENVTNFVFKLSGGTDENDLPCLRDLVNRRVTSFWQPREEERLEEADLIGVQIYGFPGAKIRAGFGDHTGFFSIHPVEPIVNPYEKEGDRQFHIPLDAGKKRWLRGGGHFVLEVGMCPPMPVAVFLSTPEETEDAD